MKKQILILIPAILLACTFFSCSSVKKLPATVAGSARARFVGTWALNKVTYEGLVPGAVQTVFNQGPPEAFEGSTWNLTNSGNGTYTLTNGTIQKIFWSYNNSNGEIFQFKQLYQGDSASKVTDGYQLQVAYVDNDRMALKSPVGLGDKTVYVVFSFNKTK
ncbi:hypothetical protein [Mucilaginibacter sp.]|uniref:hypothetical protein n=1 Tax=Mucilaginibacter sp. TaxID=1882438 RepID=UPI00284151F7|nr:hypothetical protein [Mucilaginibacter sp.]MDR3696172.1 hypothetical protein [Mucilaginibacter sp.]